MIDYGLFVFAAPPRTATSWFIKAAQLSGLGYGSVQQSHLPFNETDKWKVSLVRHPCDWLASKWASRFECSDNGFPLEIPKGHGFCFDTFIERYLESVPGAVGQMYNKYEADIVLRVEDLPWALVELLRTFDVGLPYQTMCAKLHRVNASSLIPRWDNRLREQVREAEREVMDVYEYF